ncbi:uncharacterized protein LOC108911358 [Anoplophora glabripennis]|uniref:uncharacterized protein LOC108911358 n=1 Tax=Anoplophora glabripennis TaxID=217634 RepID=UPI000873A559|nr:uncharacterized protein LOC108911358 [Anoplophora glabripennis]
METLHYQQQLASNPFKLKFHHNTSTSSSDLPRGSVQVPGSNLAGNYLEELPEEIMKKLKGIKDINLQNNPWKMEFVCKYDKWCINLNKTNTMDIKCPNWFT